MKSIRKIFINLMAMLLVVVSCFGLTACKQDVREMTITVGVYNYDEGVDAYEEVTLTVDLYGYIAENTVNQIQAYVNEGYYNDTVFYKTTVSAFSSHIMLGDFKANGDDIEMNAVKPEIDGEFDRAGVVGSNLTVKKGSIGLFRSWYKGNDEGYSVTNNSMNSGRATWFIPTSDSSAMNDWFCVFAQFDLEDEDNANAIDLITKAFEAETTEYIVYYTGEYDASKADENYGLTQHIVLKEEFEEADVDDIFEAEGKQLVCYNQQTIKVPTKDGAISAKIVKAEVKAK